LIIAYVALNAALCGINYPTLSPDTWYITPSKQQICFVADRLGVVCFANIALAIMFSGRNTLLLWITGRSRFELLTFHRWAARVAAVEGIAHTIIYWSTTNKSGANMFTLSAGIHTVNYDQIYWTWGIAAVIALGLLVFAFSILPLRAQLYEIFLFIHIALAIFILAALWYHVGLRYYRAYGYEVWLYIAFAFWGFDRVARPFRIILLNWKSWFGRNHPASRVELLPGDEFIKLTVFPSTVWKFSAGQHCFLYFPILGTNPLQSHPFSIASWDEGIPRATSLSPQNHVSSTFQLPQSATAGRPVHKRDGLEIPKSQNTRAASIELRNLTIGTIPSATFPAQTKPSISFLLRPESGLTQHLHRHLLASKTHSPQKPIPVLIEGPYGSAPLTHLRDTDTIIALAGGIGITSILGYLQLYLESFHPFNSEAEFPLPNGKSVRRMCAAKFLLFWSAREESLIRAVKSQLDDAGILAGQGVQLRIVCTGGGNEREARMDFGALVKRLVVSEGRNGRRVAVVSCGPGAMADGIRAAVVDCLGLEGVEVELVEEAFCW
jgi:predicted ferric reductase